MIRNLLTVQELAEILKLKPETVTRKASAMEIPHIRLSRREIRFDPVEIDKWLKERTHRPLMLVRRKTV